MTGILKVKDGNRSGRYFVKIYFLGQEAIGPGDGTRNLEVLEVNISSNNIRGRKVKLHLLK